MSDEPKPTWTPEQDREKLHEAAWKRHISWSHDLWCHCHDYMSHFQKRKRECGTDTEEDEAAAVSFDLTFDEGDMATAAARAEGTVDDTG